MAAGAASCCYLRGVSLITETLFIAETFYTHSEFYFRLKKVSTILAETLVRSVSSKSAAAVREVAAAPQGDLLQRYE
jgi:hypothetical protein